MPSFQQREEWTELVRGRVLGLRGCLLRSLQRLLDLVLMKLPSSRVLAAIGMPIAIFGWVNIAAWPVTGLISSRTNGFQLATTEFPLGDPQGVAVDTQGRFFVVDALNLRVQRYSPEGEFQRGWFVPKKIFAVRTTADDRVIVGAEGGARIYSPDGELLEGPSEQYHLQRGEITGPYEVRRGLIPRIIDTRTGQAVIATPWPLFLFASPFPAFLYFLVGVAFIALADLRRLRERAIALSAFPERLVSQAG